MSSKTGSQDVLMVHLAHREDVCVSLPQKPVTGDSIFKSICADLECFLLKQIGVFKLLLTLSLLELPV